MHVREGRKRIEVKITTEINFSRFWLIFRSNWKHFQFDRILQHNQTHDFPEIDFRKLISVKTNGALVHEQADEKDLQREIEDLKKKLRRAQRKQTPSSSDISSNDEGDGSYRECSETPPSESYSYKEEHSHKRRRKSSPGRGVGTKVMKKAVSQISKSPFTRGIEKVKFPRRFHQPTFPMYNGRTDPVEHVS